MIKLQSNYGRSRMQKQHQLATGNSRVISNNTSSYKQRNNYGSRDNREKAYNYADEANQQQQKTPSSHSYGHEYEVDYRQERQKQTSYEQVSKYSHQTNYSSKGNSNSNNNMQNYASYKQQKGNFTKPPPTGSTHLQRNQQVISRISKEGNVQRNLGFENEPESRQWQRPQRNQRHYDRNSHVSDRNFREQSDWPTATQRNSYKAQILMRQDEDQCSTDRRITSKPTLQTYQSAQLSRQRINNIQANRQNRCMNSNMNTPQKGTSRLKLASAQRKQQLLQKSMKLQQKLKKLTPAQSNDNQTCNTPRSRLGREQQQTQGYSRVIHGAGIRRNSAYNTPRGALSRIETNSQLQKRSRNSQVQQAGLTRNSDIAITKSPLLQSSKVDTCEAISRINQLNDKINSRIQSIIQNYSK